MDTDSAPAHNSPKNILNVLNDDCIEHILRRLVLFGDIEDFLNAAATCKRFQKTAQRFKSMFKSIKIGNDAPIRVNHAPMVLNIFGHLIESIEWGPKEQSDYYDDCNDKVFNLIVKYCDKTLKELKLLRYNSTIGGEDLFQSLQTLEVNNDLYDYRFEQHFYSGEQPWFIRPFPNLLRVKFFEVHELTDDMLTQFLSLNPQLEGLSVEHCGLVTSISFFIALRCRSLRQLCVSRISYGYLKDFQLTKSMVPVFPINNTIVDLWLRSKDRVEFPDEFLISLIKSLTALRTLSISNGCSVAYLDTYVPSISTTRVVEKILECGRALTELRYSPIWPGFELDNYNRVLSLAKNRVKVNLIVDALFNIPENILTANEAWVKLEHPPPIQAPAFPDLFLEYFIEFHRQ